MTVKNMGKFSSIASTAFAITIGVLAGAGVALLYAPHTGRDTRTKLLTKGEELKEKVSHDVFSAKTQLQNQVSEVNKVARNRAYELGNQLNKTLEEKGHMLKEKANDLHIPSLKNNS